MEEELEVGRRPMRKLLQAPTGQMEGLTGAGAVGLKKVENQTQEALGGPKRAVVPQVVPCAASSGATSAGHWGMG